MDVRFPPDARRAMPPESSNEARGGKQAGGRDSPCGRACAGCRADHSDTLGFRLRRNSRRRSDLLARRSGRRPAARQHSGARRRSAFPPSAAAPPTCFGTADGGNPKAIGIVLCAIAVLAYSVAVVVQKRVLRRVTPFQVTWLGSAAATLACLPFLPALFGEIARSHPGDVGWIIYLGAMPTALGFITWTFALRRNSAGRTGSFLYRVPVVAIVLGWALLREVPAWLAIAGGLLCLAGVSLARIER